MRTETIDGIGSIYGGEYDEITVDGVGTLKEDVTVNCLKVDGIFKSKGKISAQEIYIDGVARIFRNVKVRKVSIDGILKMRRARLYAEEITCGGIFTSNSEISADNINIDGVCSISRMYGDKIRITWESGGKINYKIPAMSMFLINFYFGKKISKTHNLVKVIECTELEASGLRAKEDRANKVKLGERCIIGKLYCDGEMEIDESCRIGKIIRG